jgi:hypothetical protein
MKLILPLCTFLLISCSTTTQHLGTINKEAFLEKDEYRGAKKPLRKGKAESESFCVGQLLFQKNAFDITESSLKPLVRASCPGNEYLQEMKIVRTWWTTIVYSRSCIEVQSFCSI